MAANRIQRPRGGPPRVTGVKPAGTTGTPRAVDRYVGPKISRPDATRSLHEILAGSAFGPEKTLPRLVDLVHTRGDLSHLIALARFRADAWAVVHDIASTKPYLFSSRHVDLLLTAHAEGHPAAGLLCDLAGIHPEFFTGQTYAKTYRRNRSDSAALAANLCERFGDATPWEATAAARTYGRLIRFNKLAGPDIERGTAAMFDAFASADERTKKHLDTAFAEWRAIKYGPTYAILNGMLAARNARIPLDGPILHGEEKARFLANAEWYFDVYMHHIDPFPPRYLDETIDAVKGDRPCPPMLLCNTGGTALQFSEFIGGNPDATRFPFEYRPVAVYPKIVSDLLRTFNLGQHRNPLTIEIYLPFPDFLDLLRQSTDVLERAGYVSVHEDRVTLFREFLRARNIPIRILLPAGEGSLRIPAFAWSGRIAAHYLSPRDPQLPEEAQSTRWAAEAASVLSF